MTGSPRISGSPTARQIFQSYVPHFVTSTSSGDGPQSGRAEGTMAFVDLAGFTALTERFAAAGLASSEELTGVLSRSFHRMVEVAANLGGDLLKFGGDSLILFFQGEEHSARATAAAWDMRAELRACAREERVPLHLSMGLHSGTFDWFAVGRVHRELIFTGPAISALVAMQHAAGTDEILLSPALALVRRSHSRRTSEPAVGVRLLARPVVRVAPEPAPLFVTDEESERFIPLRLRAHLGTPSADGEHRRVVVAFIQFAGVDPLLSAGAAGYFMRELDELVCRVQESAERYGICCLGSDVDGNGGKLILTAGAPTNSANDEERMLLCVSEVFSAGSPLDLRAGVTVGRVFAGDMGAGRRRTYTVMGDSVNLAARLMAHARPGQLLAEPDVLAHTNTGFEVTEIPAFTPRGKSVPVRALAIGRVAAAQPEVRAYSFSLVNRRKEMAFLADSLEESRRGPGRTVEIRGEPGVGKSRLMDEFLKRSAGVPTYRFSAEQYSMSVPYATFREVLRDVLGIDSGGARGAEQLAAAVQRLAPQLSPWLPLLATVAGLPLAETPESGALDAKYRKMRIAETVVDLLHARLPGPVLLLFEDTYFLDESSREILRELVASAPAAPWLICLVSYPGMEPVSDAPAPAYTRLELEPLAAEDAEELANLAAAVFPATSARLHAAMDRAGGNPLFLLEMLSSSSDASKPQALPATVEQVIAARIDELGPEDRRRLREASVLGSAFPMALLRACFGGEYGWAEDEATWSRLAPFIERGEHSAVGFRHRLYREAAYEGLPFQARRALHARVVEALEHTPAAEDEALEALALHASRAQLHEKAWHYSVLAGHRARARSANVEAAEFYHQALDHGRAGNLPSADFAAIYESRSDVLELSGHYAEADDALAAAQRLLARDDLARVLVKRGWIRERTGQYGRALRILTRARTLAAGLPEGPHRQRLEAQAGVAAAAVLFRQGRFRESAQRCRPAIAAAEASASWGVLAHGYYLLDHSLAFLKSPEAGRYGERALRIYEQLGDLVGQGNVLNNLGVNAYSEGKLDDALSFWTRSMEACDRAGDSVGAARQRNNIGEILCDRGELQEAEMLFRRALTVFQDANYALGVAFAHSNLGRVATRAGRPGEAEPHLARALEAFEALGTASFIADTHLRIIENLQSLAAADHTNALELIEELLRKQNQDGFSRAELFRLKAISLLAMGEMDEARQALIASLEADASKSPAVRRLAAALSIPLPEFEAPDPPV